MIVPAEGPVDAKICFIGEGPGRVELETGRPFTGPSGEQLNDMLAKAGLRRHEVRITNVVKDKSETPSDYDIQEALPGLVRELAALSQCNVFVPLGGVALRALSAWRYPSITRYRGSVLETFFGAKMVPSLHPAWIIRGAWHYKPVVIADIRRAVAQSTFPEIRRVPRTFLLEPTLTQVLSTLATYRAQAKSLSIDIETFGSHIACVGIAATPHESICIPLMRRYYVPYWTLEQEATVWKALDEILSSPIPKTFQNGMFDIDKLCSAGLRVENFNFDTMLAHHLLLPELPHDLGFITSVYSAEPYYKDEGKTWGHDIDEHQLWGYNCKDTVTTAESAQELEADLREEKMFDYFNSYVMQLPFPILKMKWNGIRIDRPKLAEKRTDLESKGAAEQQQLDEIVGWHVNVKGTKDVLKLLESYGIRPSRWTPTGRPKLDEEALRAYVANAPSPAFDLLFSIREKRTLISGFLGLQADASGYYHPDYLIHGTKGTRLSSRGSGEGPQIQNIPEDARDIFIPDEGCEFISADLKQAEAMVVAWIAEDAVMMQLFLDGMANPDDPDKDIHRYYASLCFNMAPRDVPKKPHRYVCKRVGHGTNYMMGPIKMATVLRAEGFNATSRQTKEWQSIYLQTFPGISRWHQETGDIVRRTRCLTTPFGRKRVFLGIFDDAMVREAVSYIPQATVGEITNRALLFLDRELPKGCRNVLQVHDNIVVQSPLDHRDKTLALMREAFNQPINIKGRELLIPIELSVGPSWGELTEVK